jgi:hypothetical protein
VVQEDAAGAVVNEPGTSAKPQCLYKRGKYSTERKRKKGRLAGEGRIKGKVPALN